MNVFNSGYSSVYDVLYNDYDFIKDAAAVKEVISLLAPGSKRLLDLGCGTGNHVQLLKDDFDVTGVDLSEGMLKSARLKNPDVNFHVGDVRTFNIDERFDVALMMGAVLGYQHTNDHIVETLKNIRAHLNGDGLLIFDVWYGPAVLSQPPTPRLKECRIDDKYVLRSVKPILQPEYNLCACHYKWWTVGELSPQEEHHIMRYFFPVEIQFFLKLAGFKVCRMSKAGFTNRPITISDWHVMFVAKAQ